MKNNKKNQRLAGMNQGPGARGQGLGKHSSLRTPSSFILHPSSFPHPSPLAPRPSRSGVLLLVVLGLLAMFGLVAVAFVILSGHAQRSAKIMQRVDQTLDSPEKTLNEAMMQVARGTSNPVSVVAPHSLLEDMYGNTAVYARILAVPLPYTVAGGQLIEFSYEIASPPNNPDATTWINDPNRLQRVGNVITFLDPSFNGASTRIVDTCPIQHRIQILATDSISAASMDAAFKASTTIRILINPVPFSGTGFGYNPATGHLDLKFVLDPTNTTTPPSYPYQQCVLTNAADPALTAKASIFDAALIPNLPLSAYTTSPDANINSVIGTIPGGANEEYDAVDYQNMMLATPPLPTAMGGTMNIPSLHRPALVNYWYKQLADSATNPQYEATFWNGTGLSDTDKRNALLSPNTVTDPTAKKNISNFKRGIMLRPLVEDNPSFTGSNTSFNPINGPWDVDNDGDGRPDSIWVDLGMPARAGKDGKLYKPLFAILCVDMDGRLNLNAHGSLAQAQTNAAGQPIYNSNVPVDGTIFADGGTPIQLPLPRGQGYGPAEINLSPILPIFPPNTNMYLRLLTGDTTTGIEGRYGTSKLPGIAGLDPLNANKWFNYGNNYWSFLIPATATANDAGVYGSPPDPSGIGIVGLDPAGRPKYTTWNGTTLNQNDPNLTTIIDCPYEFNLGLKASKGISSTLPTVNNPFSVNELERILRPFDRDATALPNRLVNLVPSLIDNRHLVTTESWDMPTLPVPSLPTGYAGVINADLNDTTIPQAVRDWIRTWFPVRNLVDLLTARYYYEFSTTSPTKATVADMNNIIGQVTTNAPALFSADILAGLKMNLNMPFGNGRDDNSNGVVDEPAPAETGEAITYKNATSTTSVPVSYDPSSVIATNGLQARQLLARYLYVLATQLVDLPYLRNSIKAPAIATDEEVARYLAQWAVNVVDYCDRDSIMTRFDYDTRYVTQTPFPTTWNPSWDTHQHIVWGCERPELLISETLAFHDRRTEDSNTDNGKVHHAPGQPTDAHNDYDQNVPPQGSLFIELYNPWGPNESPTGEFGSFNRGTNKWEQNSCVKLDQRTIPTAGNPTGDPVWRLAIATVSPPGVPTPGDINEINKDPDDPDTTLRPAIERTIYFADPTSLGAIDTSQKYFTITNIAPVLPGRYAVLGPSTVTYIGNKTVIDPTTTRRIELAPDVDPNKADQVQVLWNNGSANNDLPVGDIKPPVAVVIDRTPGATNFRLSVSEPTGGYPTLGPEQPWDAMVGHFELMQTGTIPGYKVAHLQRLANPLLPYNNTPTSQDYNPYLTIDSTPIDLTAFNGLDLIDDGSAGTVKFASHQRGERNQASDGQNNVWKQRRDNKNINPSDSTASSGHIFDYVIDHCLGYLNKSFQPMQAGTTNPTTDPSSYRGDPLSPFPWLTWNNRPFVSPLELLQVPVCRSSQLLRMYNQSQNTNNYNLLISNYPHLMNFFSTLDNGPPVVDGSQFYRLLDYINVRSRFVDTETQANPDITMAGDTSATSNGSHWFHPPFNCISNYREPGRINLNTIYDPRVFEGLMNGRITPTWADFTSSRGDNFNLPFNPPPTEMIHPFRSSSGASMVPAGTGLDYNREINATLLRAYPTTSQNPLFNYSSTNPVDDTDRNPFFRYQGLERLSNLVTTRSNVYSVWITVGYFEVIPHKDPAAGNTVIDPAHPDGYELGQEVGSDTGEIVRHRAFYMIDRTIPVGFQRGQDLNVEKAIILKRFIE